jgi:thioesterase domain-containing protein
MNLSMKRRELEQFLHEFIPLSKAMGVQVRKSNAEHVVLSAPLIPNRNHQSTVFGGSASAVAILAAWSLLHVRLKQAGLQVRLVIRQNTMKYERPIEGKFLASSSLGDLSAWERFQEMLKRKRRARISIKVTIRCHGEKVGEMLGEFVALVSPAGAG